MKAAVQRVIDAFAAQGVTVEPREFAGNDTHGPGSRERHWHFGRADRQVPGFFSR